ncbi:glycosyltransferase [Mixta sp. Marseille-Q2659]|uniref:glycosyltransferase n=1 Tax=Mixta sp. Marseille-Q2659 TaxID=2736607 RepID=UPI0023B97326|nr:glycosyltransferase [Mixta sp. Marseille-Q2659]
MKKILFSVDALDRFDEQSTYIINLIDEFITAGHWVELNTWRCSWKIQKVLVSWRDSGRLQLTQGDEALAEQVYDATLIFKGYLSTPVIERLEKQSFTSRFFFHHFDFSRLNETELDMALENKLAAAILAFNPLTEEQLKAEGAASDKVQQRAFLRNISELPAASQRESLERVLSLTPKFDEKLRAACLRQGITLSWINSDELAERITVAELLEYDAVMTSSHYAQLAFSSGIPVFISDGDRFPGYLTQQNYTLLHKAGFKCRADLPVLTAEQCASALVSDWAKAHKWSQTQQTLFSSFSFTTEEFFQPPLQQPLLSRSELRQLKLHSRICIGNLADNYNIATWLEQRSSSTARETIIKTFLSSLPEEADIGVLILTDNHKPADVTDSLASIAAQRLQPGVICVADATEQFKQALPAEQVNFLPYDNSTCLNLLAESGAIKRLIVIPAGWKLLPHAVLKMAEYHLRMPQCRAFYCDEIWYKTPEEQQVTLRPNGNFDLLRSFPYIGAVLSLDMPTARAVGGCSVGARQLPHYELLWKSIEREGLAAFSGIPEVLVEAPVDFSQWKVEEAIQAEAELQLVEHYKRFGINATVERNPVKGLLKSRYACAYNESVTVIIPGRNKAALLKNCINSLIEKTRWQNLEIIVVDNGSDEAEMLTYLAQLRALGLNTLRVLDYPGAFNYAAMVNSAASVAQGNYLLMLDNDCEIHDADWLATLMSIAQRPEVGAVGPKLIFRDGKIQHAGYLTGIQQGAINPFEFAPADSDGYLHYLSATHNVAALSGSCLLTPKSLFLQQGGLDENEFAIFLADVDYCLKLRESGYLVTWTPDCEVMHMGGATLLLSQDKDSAADIQHGSQLALLRKWRQKLTQDSRYHPLMTKYGKPFTLSEQMARIQPPLPQQPLPRILATHSGWYGCGNHRVIQPYKALEENIFTDGGLYFGVPGLMEVAEMQPDAILLQLPSGTGFPDLIKKYRSLCSAKIIVEYDDFLPNLPLKNAVRHHFPQHIIKALRRVMEQADRVVVSTQPLAEAYAPYHHDIRVAHNRLAVSQWGHLFSQRRTGKKVRVGWAGGGSHTGDLEIIQPVIKELQDNVEWVFMGMKPEGINCEFHAGVPFDLYPEKLASLNLDLALVPLEINHFNECKSNLRLLEIGACGVPIIATRIEPYQGSLPVTLVDNRFKDWMSAIKMHLADMDATSKMGDALRAAVHQDWMLRENGLDEWRTAWLDA